MNVENFAEWLRQQGHRVVNTTSSYWYDAGPHVFQAFPYHWLINPSTTELSDLLIHNRILGIRYSTPVNAKYGAISYHAVLEGSDYGEESLGKWARKNVRRGLKNCTVEPISFSKLADEGWSLQLDTLNRQGRENTMTSDIWRNLCLSASNIPGFIAWGAFVENKLAASVITFKLDNWAYMLYQQCNHEFLEQHVNNALSFVVTSFLLQQPDINSILYGLHSLDAPPSVDEFKFRMGYFAKPVRQRVVFNPFITPLIQSVSQKVLKSLHTIFPSNNFIAKAEGMVRFYLRGKSPLSKQVWPDVLVEQKEMILNVNEKNPDVVDVA